MEMEEFLHLSISAITITLAFSMFNIGSFPVIFVAVGLAFILHELGHRVVARLYGAHAVYRAWTTGLFLAVVMAFMTAGRFIFAAPGAVYIYGKNLSKKESGIVALAGPFVNLILAAFFLFLGAGTFVLGYGISSLAEYGFIINVWLGMFNMLPVPPLDGSKVARWSPTAWAAMLVLFIMLFFWTI